MLSTAIPMCNGLGQLLARWRIRIDMTAKKTIG